MQELKKISIPVIGMACAACAVNVESHLGSQAGIVSASVNYGNKTVRLEYDSSMVSMPDLRKAVRDIGYDLFIEEDSLNTLDEIEHRRFKVLQKKLLVAALLSLPVFILSMFFHHAFSYQNIVLALLTTPVVLFSGSEFYLNAFRQLKHMVFAMDSLIATGTGVAYLYSLFNTLFPAVLERYDLAPDVYFESAALIIFFVLLGRYLEEKARKSASSSIRKLIGLQPRSVKVKRDGEDFELPASMVIPGDQVRLLNGDKVPLDGRVLSGTAYADESSITGEPMPVSKVIGSLVYAGTLIQQGNVVVESLKAGNDTMLANIIRLVEEAQSTKPPIQRLVDRVAGVFVPLIFFLSAITFTAWILTGTFSHAMVSSINVLIIACPCALGLATPTALIAGISRGASEGILIRNASTLEIANKVDTVVMDKTGTMTSGTPVVKHLVWSASATESDKAVLRQLESLSNHPLAGSIIDHPDLRTQWHSMEEQQFDHFEEIPGKGIIASLGCTRWVVGNTALLKENGITVDLSATASIPGSTVVGYGKQDQLLATIEITDELKPEACLAVGKLDKLGIDIALVSGDSEQAVGKVARDAGINRYYANTLPAEKGHLISDLQRSGKKVAMIGDGINDAYALSRADLGIAMGNGTDIAIESAGIVLMRSDLTHAVSAILLSRMVVRTVKQNLFWAFFYNLAAIPIAAGLIYPFSGQLLDPMIAGAAMALSSITVVGNSLRLNRIKL